MPARVITNSQGGNHSVAQSAATTPIKSVAIVNEKKELNGSAPNQQEVSKSLKEILSHEDRAKFYTGQERLGLQANQVRRVRELQEENDNLQREVTLKEKELVDCKDPLAILADIEHRKIIIARNTGEILKIYSQNEERIKRISELEMLNEKLQKEMMGTQGEFITANDMEKKTQCASKFFMFKSSIERNLQEIEELSRN